MKKLIASIFGILLVTGLAIAEPPDGKGNNKGDIEPGSIGLAEIDPTQVQVRVGGTCSVGRFIAAIAGDGSVTCENGTDSNENTVLGRSVFTSNSTGGHSNIAIGSQALSNNTSGRNNTAVGKQALYSNIDGFFNTANGDSALYQNTGGRFNVAIGGDALRRLTTGYYNIGIGFGGGQNLTTGHNNIAIGNGGVSGETHTIRVGVYQTRAFVAGIRGVTTGLSDAVSVLIDSNGQLGTTSSSRRYKEDIHDMGTASERLLQLRPVSFRYIEAYADNEKPLDYGLIAEEVAEVFPELVVYNENRQPETVKYRLLSSLLLNELQKQQSELNDLSGQLAELSELVNRMAQAENRPSQ